MKPDAFHSLTKKRLPYSTSCARYGMSEPVAPPPAAHCLTASAPFLFSASGAAA